MPSRTSIFRRFISFGLISKLLMFPVVFIAAGITMGSAGSGDVPLSVDPVKPAAPPVVTASVTDLSVYAYPNPYLSSVNFKIFSPEPGHAFLDVFDDKGGRLTTIVKRDIKANVTELIKYRVPDYVTSNLYYRLTVNNNTTTGIVVCGR